MIRVVWSVGGMQVRSAFVGKDVGLGETGMVFSAGADDAAAVGAARSPSAPAPSAQTEARTRDRVQRAVSEWGPVTASRIAGELGLTPAAVRRHLDALAADDIITEHDQPVPGGRRGRGRPARAFVLSERGHERLTTNYDAMATAALQSLEDAVGPAAVSHFAAERMAELEDQLRADLPDADTPLPERTRALAAALSREGFAATARPMPGAAPGAPAVGLQLCQGHCPMQHVANEFRQFCDAETEMISRVLGAHVQRLATLAGGEHVCTTFVPTPALPATGGQRAATHHTDPMHHDAENEGAPS